MIPVPRVRGLIGWFGSMAMVLGACASSPPPSTLPVPAAVHGILTVGGHTVAAAGAQPPRLTGYLGTRALRMSMVAHGAIGGPAGGTVAASIDILGPEGDEAQVRPAVLTLLRLQPAGIDSGGGMEPAARSDLACEARLDAGLAGGSIRCDLIPVDGGGHFGASLTWTSDRPLDVAPLALQATYEIGGNVPVSGTAQVWTSPAGLVRTDGGAFVVFPQILVAGDRLHPSLLRVFVRGYAGDGTYTTVEAVIDGQDATESVLIGLGSDARAVPAAILVEQTEPDDVESIEFSGCTVELAGDATEGDLRCTGSRPVADGDRTLRLTWRPAP